MPEAFIVAAVRTAAGRRGGRLSGWHPTDLAAEVLDTLLARTGADPALVDDVLMGCVSQIGEQSSNVARNAVLASRLSESTPGTTIDRQCGSSQQALHFAAQAVMSGTMDVVIAAGVESMSRVPMLSAHALPLQHGMGHYVGPRIQARYGLEAFSQFDGAEMLATKHDFTRDALDRFALDSHRRAAAATEAGHFAAEIHAVPLRDAEGRATPKAMHDVDEGIRFDATEASIAAVRLLREGGRLSAASASQIADGASGVMVVNERGLKALNVEPMARIHHMTVLGHDPVVMLEAPGPATLLAMQRTGMKLDAIDLFEINEAFASVPLAWLRITGADPAKMNVNGGAIALGHPLGASGTKLMTTLVHELRRRRSRFGLQAMCEGGGMANVTIVERL